MTAVLLDVVGCGEAFRRYHLPVIQMLRAAGHVLVRACIDTNADAAADLARILGGADVASSTGDIDVSSADAVVVAVPPQAHLTVALPYVERGKAALLEKPAVVSIRELQTLQDAAPAPQERVVVNQFRRAAPGLAVLRDLVASGALGRVETVHASEGFRWSWAPASDYMVSSAYGGVLWDTGTHLIDAALYALGVSDRRMDVRIGQVEKSPSVEPAHDCRFDSNVDTPYGDVRLNVRLDRRQPLPAGLKIIGDRATAFVPAGFATSVLVRFGNGPIQSVGASGSGVRGVWGAFVSVYEALLAKLGDAPRSTIFDLRQFETLVELMEAVHGV